MRQDGCPLRVWFFRFCFLWGFIKQMARRVRVALLLSEVSRHQGVAIDCNNHELSARRWPADGLTRVMSDLVVGRSGASRLTSASYT